MGYHTVKPDYKSGDTTILSPNRGELDALAVLWAEQRSGNRPLGLSEIYRRVCERRRGYGEPEPAYTTVSTHLRSLVKKKLIREIGSSQKKRAPSRGIFTPATRSPGTSYQSIYGPAEVLQSTFRALADAYPPSRRLDAIVDFARAQEIPDQVINKMERLLQTIP